ncbi:MAG: hypothetical protein ABSF55_03010 [Candidatus Staskawiczbacteria bacterium]|jgi:hypothetical protein
MTVYCFELALLIDGCSKVKSHQYKATGTFFAPSDKKAKGHAKKVIVPFYELAQIRHDGDFCRVKSVISIVIQKFSKKGQRMVLVPVSLK